MYMRVQLIRCDSNQGIHTLHNMRIGEENIFMNSVEVEPSTMLDGKTDVLRARKVPKSL